MKAKGIEFINLSAQEKAKWKKVLAPIGDEYAAELEAKKLPGKKILGGVERSWRRRSRPRACCKAGFG